MSITITTPHSSNNAVDLSCFRSTGAISHFGLQPSVEGVSEAVQSTSTMCIHCNRAIDSSLDICPVCGGNQRVPVQQQVASASTSTSSASRSNAALLAIFLGSFGLHKFYLGKTGTGFLYLLFCWTYIPGIIGFFEGLYYLTMKDEQFREKFG